MTKQDLKKKLKDNRFFLAELLLCVLLVTIQSLSAGHDINFSPINGSFQNFNPIRRLLAGQVPYRDFIDYLGMGHLYAGGAVTLLFGCNFRSSLIAFTFLTTVSFACISYILAYLVFNKKEHAIALTNIAIGLDLILFNLVPENPIGEDLFAETTHSAFYVGNSARAIRAFILPLTCLFLFLIIRALKKKNLENSKYVYYICGGVAAGFSFLWSNDYGISCWLCLLLTMLWYSFSETRKILLSLARFGIALVSSLLSIVIFAEIFTLGHIGGWFKAVFGTGGYQSWYYNSAKSFFVWDVDLSPGVVLQFLLILAYIALMFFDGHKNNDRLLRYAFLAYINMACFCALQEYKLLSGGNSKEYATMVTFLTLFFEAFSFLKKRYKKLPAKKIAYAFSFILCFCWLAGLTVKEVKHATAENEGTYIPELGGNLSDLDYDILSAKEFLGSERVFATYASAQEVVSGNFQPSGIDYIIHVLGDAEREAYLKAFNEKDFRYAATLNPGFSDWEYWAERANWFFYRELYGNWHPVYSNTYELYWEKNTDYNGVISGDFTPVTEDVGLEGKKIVIDCDSSVNGIADVYIDYKLIKKDGTRPLFNHNKLLQVVNSGTFFATERGYESNYLRPESAEYIPVPIVNGHGEVTLYPTPDDCLTLEINELSCDTVYTVKYDYMSVDQVYAENNNTVIQVKTTKAAEHNAEYIDSVIINGKTVPVQSVTGNVNYIILTLTGTSYTEEIKAGQSLQITHSR